MQNLKKEYLNFGKRGGGMNHAQKARELFLKGANCSQAVFAAFSDVTGMTESEACRLAAAFGGGFARQREVCGAVSGMTLVLGALYGYDDIVDQHKKAEIYAKEQALCNRFREKYGTIICRELLQNRVAGIGTTPVPDARTEEYYKTRPCLATIETAAELMDTFIRENPPPAKE